MTTPPGQAVTAREAGAAGRAAAALPAEQVSLVDLLDRVLARGVVASGEITLTVADVDLVQISLRALLSSVRPELSGGNVADRGGGGRHDPGTP